MDDALKEQLVTCEKLLSQIKAEYPHGNFDREMLHGELDFGYRRIRELRQKLDAVPKVVREFCRFTQSLSVPKETVLSFLSFLLNSPIYLAALSEHGCREIAFRMAACSEELNIPLAELNQIVGRMHLYGTGSKLSACRNLSSSY